MYFEVKKQEMVSKTFRLPLDFLARLGNVAPQKGVSLNNLGGQCWEYALANLRDNDDQQKT